MYYGPIRTPSNSDNIISNNSTTFKSVKSASSSLNSILID